MPSFKLNCFLMLVVTVLATVLVHEAGGCSRISHGTDGQGASRYYVCGKCGIPIEMTVIVRNQLIEPTFDFNITLTEEPQRELIHFLEKAAKLDKRFEFEASFHSQWGYFLSSINHRASSPEESYYWMMFDFLSGESLDMGASFHVPEHRDTVLFNLTQYSH